jgi:hypothetical protein
LIFTIVKSAQALTDLDTLDEDTADSNGCANWPQGGGSSGPDDDLFGQLGPG